MNEIAYRMLKQIADKKNLPLPPITEPFGSPAWVSFLVLLNKAV